MANLLIDIGNSDCKVACAHGTELGEIFRSSSADLLEFILSIIADRYFKVIVLSTVREDDPQMQSVLKGMCGKLVVLTKETGLPDGFTIGFEPKTLGMDRLAGALAVSRLFSGKDCIKFDFGTALTVDFINSDGVYAGGNISLGLQSRFRALNTFTKRLPLLTPTEEFNETGTDTVGSITAGVILGVIFEVEGYLRKNPDRTAVFTGGDSVYFAKKMDTPVYVIQNLVLIGLAIIADYYAQN